MADNRKYRTIRLYAFVSGAAALAAIAGVAITLAIQERNDRALSAEIERTSVELKVAGEQIAEIKDANLITMNDFIGAYPQIEHLQSDYDQKVAKFADLCGLAQQRDAHRGLINAQRLHGGYHPETWQNMAEIVDLVRQINEITKREIAVTRSMAALPEKERVQFWHEQFMPLSAQEHALRERLSVAGQSMSPDSKLQ